MKVIQHFEELSEAQIFKMTDRLQTLSFHSFEARGKSRGEGSAGPVNSGLRIL